MDVMPNTWWVTQALEGGGPVHVVSWIAWVVGSIVLHELSHGWAALACGDRTPAESGHMTWNPLVHMGGMSLAMFALVGIAWGAMPVDPSRFRRRYDDALVSGAGPMMNAALAAVCIVALALWIAFAPGEEPLRSNMLTFLLLGAGLNIVLGLFNLLPVFPLDGGHIAASLSPAYRRFIESDQGRLGSILVFLGAFWFLGGRIFSFGFDVAGKAAVGLAGVVGG